MCMALSVWLVLLGGFVLLVGIPYIGEVSCFFQEDQQVIELAVGIVGEEAFDGDGVFGLQGIAEWGIVYNEGAGEVTAEFCNVLDVAAADEDAVLAV